MYLGTIAAIGPLSSQTMTRGVAAVLLEQENDLEWLEKVFRNMWVVILRVLNTIMTWISCVGAESFTWILEASCTAYSFVEKHPHPFHIVGWSIFFGPIIILIPCLLLLEILILLLFQLSFISHGLTFSSKLSPGSLADRFDALKDYFMDWRESLFATVEQWTATCNKWTVDFPPLLVLRLLAGTMSLFILFGLWSGW